ncbi:HAD-IA family hydrolase [Oryzifoliimicrobium ureilyticus]|uniref:HAD-IA family hydrolase n=1 Tax=Oryzifoliimicrobium ureilyticus TaxID=3113724 RepID=UPI0030763204
MKLALFDCDGTLVDSAGLIHEVMVRTFAQFGHHLPDVSDTKSIIGLTLDLTIARLLGRVHVDEDSISMAAYYKAIYAEVRAEPGREVRLYDNISAVIDSLAAREDVLIGAVTGKSRRGLEQVLQVHGFKPHFVVSRTADDCPSKPHPAMVTECCDEVGVQPSEAIVIGDAIYDMLMAKAAGAQAVGVAWGYASTAALKEAGADAIAEQPSDILAYI